MEEKIEPEPQENIQNTKEKTTNKKRYIIFSALIFLLIIFVSIIIFLFLKQSVSPVKNENLTNNLPYPSQPTDEDVVQMKTADGLTSFLFPYGLFEKEEKLEIIVVPPTCNLPEETTRHVSSATRLNVVDKANILPSKYFSITMDYGIRNISHIDESTLSIYHCTYENTNPEKLDSEIDFTKKTVSAKTNKLGVFELLGQLKCPKDTREPDDSYKIHGGQDIEFGIPTASVLDNPKDIDFYFIYIEEGKSYAVRTLDLANGVNTIINLSSNGVDVLQTNQKEPNEPIIIDKKLFEDHVQIEVTAESESKTGCDATYNLLIEEY